MSKISVSAHIKAVSSAGKPKQQREPPWDLLTVITSTERNLCELRFKLMTDRHTELLGKVGKSLIEVGEFLQGQGGRP